MRDLPNIEKSGFRRGEYVGYANGVWRIRRNPSGGWTAWLNGRFTFRQAPTLAHLSTVLAAYEANRGPE